jgi:hypothetical protein
LKNGFILFFGRFWSNDLPSERKQMLAGHALAEGLVQAVHEGVALGFDGHTQRTNKPHLGAGSLRRDAPVNRHCRVAGGKAALRTRPPRRFALKQDDRGADRSRVSDEIFPTVVFSSFPSFPSVRVLWLRLAALRQGFSPPTKLLNKCRTDNNFRKTWAARPGGAAFTAGRG